MSCLPTMSCFKGRTPDEEIRYGVSCETALVVGSVFVAASIQALSGLTQMFTAPDMPIGFAIWFFVWWTGVFIMSILIVAMASIFAGYIPDPDEPQLQTGPALRINYAICATGTLTVFGILPIIIGWGYVRASYRTDGPWLGAGVVIALLMLAAFVCAASCYEKSVLAMLEVRWAKEAKVRHAEEDKQAKESAGGEGGGSTAGGHVQQAGRPHDTAAGSSDQAPRSRGDASSLKVGQNSGPHTPPPSFKRRCPTYLRSIAVSTRADWQQAPDPQATTWLRTALTATCGAAVQEIDSLMQQQKYPLLVLHGDQSTAFERSLLSSCQDYVISACRSVDHHLRMKPLDPLSNDLVSGVSAGYNVELQAAFGEAGVAYKEQQLPTLMVLRCPSVKVQAVLDAAAAAGFTPGAVRCQLPIVGLLCGELLATNQQGSTTARVPATGEICEESPNQQGSTAASVPATGKLCGVAPNLIAVVRLAMREFLQQLLEVTCHGPSPFPLPSTTPGKSKGQLESADLTASPNKAGLSHLIMDIPPTQAGTKPGRLKSIKSFQPERVGILWNNKLRSKSTKL